MCWTFATEDCAVGGTQTNCSAGGYEWCCRPFETCTIKENQVNICWAPWDNPNENRSAPDALIYNQANFPVLPALSVSSAAEPTASTSNASLSLGAIIGIGIGCGVAAFALAAGAGFLLFRRKIISVSHGPTQQAVPQRLELGNDRVAEIDDRKMNEWVSELPAVRH